MSDTTAVVHGTCICVYLYVHVCVYVCRCVCICVWVCGCMGVYRELSKRRDICHSVKGPTDPYPSAISVPVDMATTTIFRVTM